MAYRIWLFAFALTLAGGCGPLTESRESQLETECTQVRINGLFFYLHDSQGYPITEATITARDGEYVGVLTEVGDGEYSGVPERVGEYMITIQAPGYSDTELGPIPVVMDGLCHVKTTVRRMEFWP